jgi:hypothetical protein
MSLTEHDIDALKHEWESVVGEAEAAEADPSVKYAVTVSVRLISDEDLEIVVPTISDRLAKLVFRIIETSKSSPIVSEVDHGDLRVDLKEMLAALEFHRYHHWETHVLPTRRLFEGNLHS